MFESDTKGWHGSYSLMGKISAESFPMVIAKDKILKGLYKPKKIKDYFSMDEDINHYDELQTDEDDIFNPKYKSPPKVKRKILKICEPNTKRAIPEEYKYHHSNHKDMYNLTKILKAQQSKIGTIYDPKKEYVWARTISGPPWNALSGREKGGILGIKNIDINFNEKKGENSKNKIENINKEKKIINKEKEKEKKIFPEYFDTKKGVDMNKFGKRTTIKTIYDSRIREFRPFIKKIGQKTMRVKNILKNLEIEAKKKLKNKKHINLNLDILEESDAFYSDSSENTNSKRKKKKKSKPKKNLKKYPASKIPCHTINFAKVLSREKFYKKSRNEEGIRPFFSPKYTLVEPRSLTMVSYNKKTEGKIPSKRLNVINNDLYFDINKALNKVNNHQENKVRLFKNSLEKYRNEKLPLHMNNLYNRQSLESITDKGLEMNNFSSSERTADFSTFCKKKSYNKMINYGLLRNERKEQYSILEKIGKTLWNKNRIKNFFEFYLKNLDMDNVTYTGKKFDSITLKTVEPVGCLTDKEKELFSVNFSK